ncbi:RsfA family transcriptional regulator [Bacillus sp. EB01]|uniref:RsfA family transcriptional regulator n=1 Tax=Bacillus sp. EB01 TaxID=1347086 RepID=UPI0005C79379|nr:RsfA family transcriptional regulator [Bacillus sp. EB01]
MSSTRQDAWTADEDLLLAEVILRNIREGGTQLQAFEEVGRKLSRTSAACGFRWNSHVRKQYKAGIEHAKKQRKEAKKNSRESKDQQLETPKQPVVQLLADSQSVEDVQSVQPNPGSSIPEFKDVLAYLENLYARAGNSANEYEQALVRIRELERENESLLKELNTLEEDYQALMSILDRARKMAADKEEAAQGQHKAKFQIDKFGNLERVE